MNDQEQADSRIDELEQRFTFQEDLIQALQEEIVRQQIDMQAMQLQLRQLNERIKEFGSKFIDGGDPSKDETPPHY